VIGSPGLSKIIIKKEDYVHNTRNKAHRAGLHKVLTLHYVDSSVRWQRRALPQLGINLHEI